MLFFFGWMLECQMLRGGCARDLLYARGPWGCDNRQGALRASGVETPLPGVGALRPLYKMYLRA